LRSARQPANAHIVPGTVLEESAALLKDMRLERGGQRAPTAFVRDAAARRL